MLAFSLALFLLQSSAPVAVASPTPVPATGPAPALGRSSEPARPKTLADHAAEMKAKGTPAKQVSFEDVQTVDPADAAEDPAPKAAPGSHATASKKSGKAASGDAGATQAQRRMDRAVAKGLAVPERTRSSSRDRARQEWDDAAEACRKTPGCIPQYRDDPRYGENKPLKTDRELTEDIRKRGFSEPHPLPK